MYDFKAWEEFGWFFFTAVAVALFEILIKFDPSGITDWKAWGVALFAACVRAGAGAALAFFAKRSLNPAPDRP